MLVLLLSSPLSLLCPCLSNMYIIPPSLHSLPFNSPRLQPGVYPGSDRLLRTPRLWQRPPVPPAFPRQLVSEHERPARPTRFSVFVNMWPYLSAELFSRESNLTNEKEKKTFFQVLFTGVVDEAGERVLARLGGSMAKGVADMNVLVTDKVRRTVKFLCAVAKGVPIVTTHWLEKVSCYILAVKTGPRPAFFFSNCV